MDDESALCCQCGLCCDGSLFDSMDVQPEDRDCGLATFNVGPSGEHTIFLQPCPALLSKRCEIYPRRPLACVEYACRTLRHLRKGKVSFAEASARIQAAVAHAQRIRAGIAAITGKSEAGFMQRLYAELNAAEPDENTIAGLRIDMTALELRFDRYFRSPGGKREIMLADENKAWVDTGSADHVPRQCHTPMSDDAPDH